MAFTTPNLPLKARIHRGINLSLPVPPDGWTSVAAAIRTTLQGLQLPTTSTYPSPILLLFPRGTDVRGPGQFHPGDLIEAPEKSGLYYSVLAVTDRWKGFPNEYRIATALALSTHYDNPSGGPWWVYPQP